MIPRKRCEVCGAPSRDNICDACYPLVRARDEWLRSRRELAGALADTMELEREELVARVLAAKN